MVIGSLWVQLERVNPRPSPTHTTRESEWAKAEAVLKCCNSVFERNRVDSGAMKRERQDTTYARRAFIVDEDLHQQRVREGDLGALSYVLATEAVATVKDDVSTTDGATMIDGSSSNGITHGVSTTDGATMIDRSATNGVPHVDQAGSGKPDPPAC
uniref:Integrase core domain containing protein n=1 Tax=Solanum tuberosum TaxID=4113 RepID=M1DPW3_SOLTU